MPVAAKIALQTAGATVGPLDAEPLARREAARGVLGDEGGGRGRAAPPGAAQERHAEREPPRRWRGRRRGARDG
jgi:hypothetical protein